MKYVFLVVLSLSSLLAGHASGSQQQVAAAQSSFEFCKKMARSGDQRAAIAALVFPKFANIDVVMMSDKTYPSRTELDAAKPYLRDELACNRKFIADIQRISGGSSTSPMLANAKRLNRDVENTVAKFLSGDMTYGAYFTSLRNLSNHYTERHTALSRAEEQAAYEQRMRAYQNAVNGMSDAFKNTPCIACGLSDRFGNDGESSSSPSYSAPSPSYNSPSSATDWDWDWDYQPANGQWVCRGIQTGQYAVPDRCAMDIKDDNRWPG